MVGHTGVLEAAVKAVEAVDEAVRVIVEAALEQDGFVLLCADHGNAECMIAQDGTPMTAPHGKSRAAHCPSIRAQRACGTGACATSCPTMLALCGLQKPPEMTGREPAARRCVRAGALLKPSGSPAKEKGRGNRKQVRPKTQRDIGRGKTSQDVQSKSK